MAYSTFTSTLTCTWCNEEFETKNVRMRKVLCPSCKAHEKTIDRYAGDKKYSDVSLEQKMRAYKDTTLRYGQGSSQSKLQAYQEAERARQRGE